MKKSKSNADDAQEPSKKKRRVEEGVETPAKAQKPSVAGANSQKKELKTEKKAKEVEAESPSEGPRKSEKKAAAPPPSIKNIARSATSRAKAALAQSRKAKSS